MESKIDEDKLNDSIAIIKIKFLQDFTKELKKLINTELVNIFLDELGKDLFSEMKNRKAKFDYDKYEKMYLNYLRNKAMKWLSEIDPDEWIKEIRGYDDE